MIDLHSKTAALTATQALQLVHILFDKARECQDPAIKLALCGNADAYLGNMKQLVKRATTASTNHNDDSERTVKEEIASAYLDHANLVADLGHAILAVNSRRRAEKWGGPGSKNDVVLPEGKKLSRVVDVATVPATIFPADISPPALPWNFPELDGRFVDTLQLVSCLGLLKQDPDSIPDDSLEPVARKWLKEMTRNIDERARLETLATDIIRAFSNDEIKDNKVIAEVLCLVPVLEEDNVRFLLRQFQNYIKGSHILDINALRGLARLLQTAAPSYLHAQDLIEILGFMSARLRETHYQSPDHIFELTVAVSSILNAMADTKVTKLDREGLHEPLLAFLSDLQGNDNPQLKYYALYSFQALLRIPDDESPWQATVRRTTKVIKGVSGLVSAVKGLDLDSFMTGLQNIQDGFQGFQQVFELARTAYEGVTAVYEGEQDLIASVKDGLKFNHKRAWYTALRGTDTLIDGGELAKFRVLVCSAPCRRELAFQWGVCQRLGSMAANPLWGNETRQGAMRFLEEIYRGDTVWGQLPPIKTYILDILKQLSLLDGDLQAALLLKELATDGDAVHRNCTSADPSTHLLKSGLPEFASPSLLDRVQRRIDVEADLRRIARLRITESGGTVYVPPLAKADLRVSDKTFPLMPMVDEFLVGNGKVLLLLGDSGAGKTTFNHHLDLKLWNEYKPKTGRIPLLISLPAIDRPEKDLIAKHLRICEFSEPQIRELKDREFIIICDGYDESQQMQNLYNSNGLNTNGGWNAQMIVSCRSEYLGQDYRDLFQPESSNTSDPASFQPQRLNASEPVSFQLGMLNTSDPVLFQQAVLVPFSIDQVKEYIAQYVAIERPLWVASDYEGVLGQIPSLLDLVENPFLLTLSLEVLPRITDPGQKLASNKITRALLYDEFVVQWLERNKRRLSAQVLSDPERRAFKSLSDDGFTQQGLVYLKELSAAIYKEQGGNPVIEYLKARDNSTWKERFFGRNDEEIQLLQRAIPMTRIGCRFGFIHRSLLEYGVSRAIYEPQNRVGLKLAAARADNDRRKSVDSAFSFEMDEVADETTVNLTVKGPDPDSLLAKRNFIKDASVLQFLAERVEQEPVFKDQLLGYIESSKVDKKWRTAAANAITILVRAGVRFYGADLKGIQVPRADLSGGHFDSAQLEGADLRKANHRNIWLRQVNLSNDGGEILLIFTGR